MPDCAAISAASLALVKPASPASSQVWPRCAAGSASTAAAASAKSAHDAADTLPVPDLPITAPCFTASGTEPAKFSLYQPLRSNTQPRPDARSSAAVARCSSASLSGERSACRKLIKPRF
ncbi:hypothetical protein CVM52_21180 [Pseudooceanicola lipolyticus]|uniref:Uncharacterized protein n=1 Tax=Pseudooceanicola lipolyticus TaxID=2029104 RepID=A0A2M8IVW6_9RHOB|nr:hypothetical protein CVM52_21180 [Pseudooceanicola lipolyticus]